MSTTEIKITCIEEHIYVDMCSKLPSQIECLSYPFEVLWVKIILYNL